MSVPLEKEGATVSQLGQGIYRLSEVVQYTGLPATTVRAWFKWRSDKLGQGPIFTSDYEEVEGDYAVSFLNLVDAYVAAFFRDQGVLPQIIRRAYVKLQDELHTPHPFAHADLRTDGIRIIEHTLAGNAESVLRDPVSEQFHFPQMKNRLTRVVLKQLVYGKATHLAQAWNISTGVLIKPGVCFGKPTIKGTGVSTFVVANQYFANKNNAARVARLFNISATDVRNAVNFEKSLKQRQAA